MFRETQFPNRIDCRLLQIQCPIHIPCERGERRVVRTGVIYPAAAAPPAPPRPPRRSAVPPAFHVRELFCFPLFS